MMIDDECRHNKLRYIEDCSKPYCRECEQFVNIGGNAAKIINIDRSYMVNTHSNDQKLKHYGITDPIEGTGVTKDTDVSEPIGLTATRKHNNWV